MTFYKDSMSVELPITSDGRSLPVCETCLRNSKLEKRKTGRKVHIYNSSYSRDRDWEDCSLRPA
jgi:hypothetical protein